jgi:lysozyme
MLEQVNKLRALLREKHPPTLIVVITVLSIVLQVLLQIAGLFPSTHTTTIVERTPAPATQHATAVTAKADVVPATCPAPAQLGGCLQATAPHPVLAGLASVRTILGPKGPDVSSYQPNVNWVQVKAAAYRFAFVKATEGRSYVNPYFARDWRELQRLGLPHGAYDFARPQPGWSGAAEARHYYAIVKAAGGFNSLPPVLDVEASVLGSTATHAWVGQFVAEIRHLTGRHDVTIYTGAWFWNPRSCCSSFGTHLWVSGYANSITLPSGWSHADFWQFTDGTYGPFPHAVPGIGKVDISVYRGGDLAALAGGQSAAQARRKAKERALKAARRSHRIVHAKIHKRCRGHVAHHSAACHVLFAQNARLHHRYGRALK